MANFYVFYVFAITLALFISLVVCCSIITGIQVTVTMSGPSPWSTRYIKLCSKGIHICGPTEWIVLV